MRLSSQVPASPSRTPRPVGITALSVFFAFGALASGLAAVSLLTPGGYLEPIWRLNPKGHAGLSALGSWAPVLLGVVSIACAAAAFGFISGRRWGYGLGIALLLLNLVGDLANVAFGVEPRALVGIPIVALLLWYLSSRTVRQYFGQAVRCAA
jgi:hypothetical protein